MAMHVMVTLWSILAKQRGSDSGWRGLVCWWMWIRSSGRSSRSKGGHEMASARSFQPQQALHCFCHFIGHGYVTQSLHLWSLIHFYDAMYRRTPASTGIHDLDTLEARGAAFVTTQQQPRPRRRRSSAPIARANESHSCSQLSGLNIFGISAYGIILIATVLALVAVLVVFIYLVTSVSTRYVRR